FSLAASRLGWALPEIETISLHGRPVGLLRPLLHPGSRMLALTSDSTGPREVATLLSRLGFGGSKMTVLEALGGPDERIQSTTADGFALENINPLNLLALDVRANPRATILPFAPGLPDDAFEHDGQI